MATISYLLCILLAFSIPSTASTNSTDFIRTSCNKTLYPRICFRSLARYADSIANNSVYLACAATNVSLAHARSVSNRISALCANSTATGREAEALNDCSDSLGDAVDQIRQSAVEIARLDTASGPEVAWRVSNVQTWMSAALTNEDTCTDELGEVSHASPTNADFCRRVRKAMRHASITLALVNSLVAGR